MNISFFKIIFYFCLLAQLVVFYSCGGDKGDKLNQDSSAGVNADGSLNDRDGGGTMLPDISTNTDSLGLTELWGDWFECADNDCKSLNYFGRRFYEDGRYTIIFSEINPHQSGENYCYLSRSDFISLYWWDGEKLTLSRPITGGKFKMLWRIKGDIAEITFGEEKWKSKRLSVSKAKGPCKDQQPMVCPRFISFNTTDICDWNWDCDNASFIITCNRQETGKYVCNCERDGSVSSSRFEFDHNICEEDAVKDPISFAKTNCNWDIWVPEMFDNQ